MAMHPIETLEQLVRNLNMGPGYDGYKGIIDTIHFKAKDIDHLWSKRLDEHERVNVYDTPGLEVIISRWKPGQTTHIHDYNAQQAWTKVISGQLILEFFGVKAGERHAPILETQLLNEGEFIYMNDSFGFHRFSNLNTTDAVAIHMYADKIEKWHLYNDRNGEVDTLPTYYDRVL
jgi:cysteine dioxygenase